MRYLLSSLAMIAPCFWLPRIQSGDLESHVYNAWLAQLIARGQAPGLHIQTQWTNVLFDLGLSALWPLGPVAAEKIAVALSVLIFVWGAFAFATVAGPGKRTPWFLLPIVAVLAYGWVFHAGFFNYYLALGLGFWALALAWRPGRARMAGALAILALALTAHSLAVAWAAGALGYRKLAGQMRPRFRPVLVLGSVALLLAVGRFLEWNCQTLRNPVQAALVTGSDQICVYGAKYHVLQLVLLAIWGILFVRILERGGWRRLAVDTPMQIAVITAAGVLLIPSGIQLPGYHHAIVYIAERMSLVVGICACAVLARAHPRRLELGAIAGLAAVFFGFLYVDGRSISRVEDRMRQAVAQLPPGSRVVSSVSDPSSRADPLVHLIDRVCVDRCFSYGNFEPSTAAFRVRADKGNPVVVANYADSYAMQTGTYIVKPADLPLYGIFPVSGGAEFTVRSLEAAETFQVARLEERR